MKQNTFREQFHVFSPGAAVPSSCLFNFDNCRRHETTFCVYRNSATKTPRGPNVLSHQHFRRGVAVRERTSTSSIHSLFILILSFILYSFMFCCLSFAVSLFLFLFFYISYFLPSFIKYFCPFWHSLFRLYYVLSLWQLFRGFLSISRKYQNSTLKQVKTVSFRNSLN
jgi:hypothetical protein